MSLSISVSEVTSIVNGVILQDTPSQHRSHHHLTITGVSTDSRTVQPGDLFIALEGDKFDGHAFVDTAFTRGAIAALVRLKPSVQASDTDLMPVIQVRNTLLAYQVLARYWRQQFPIPVIAITGSVGKTTTKEMLAAILATQGQVLKTQANFNNEVGVPKTLLELTSKHDYAVIEMGMRGQGEIAELTQIAVPDIALITNVGTAHIGRLGSEEAIAQAKCELLEHLPENGVAILNHDNPRLLDTAARVWHGTTLTYGLQGGDIRGFIPKTASNCSSQMIIEGLGPDSINVPLPLTGKHNALNYLGAITAASVLKLNWQPILEGIKVDLPSGRAKRYTIPNDVAILDETYNAGFESMMAALQVLRDTPGKRHIAVLGTMKELGPWSVDLHHRIGVAVQQLGIDCLITLADPTEQTALISGASSVLAYPCSTPTEAVDALLSVVQSGDRILFKASRSVGLEQVIMHFQQRWSTTRS